MVQSFRAANRVDASAGIDILSSPVHSWNLPFSVFLVLQVLGICTVTLHVLEVSSTQQYYERLCVSATDFEFWEWINSNTRK